MTQPQPQQHNDANRRRQLVSIRINDSYVNDDGYYVVNGIVVLPGDSDYCRPQRSKSIEHFMALFGGDRRDLMVEAPTDDYNDEGEDAEEEERDVEEAHRNLKGSSSSSDYGYYYGWGKGKVRIQYMEFRFLCCTPLVNFSRCVVYLSNNRAKERVDTVAASRE